MVLARVLLAVHRIIHALEGQQSGTRGSLVVDGIESLRRNHTDAGSDGSDEVLVPRLRDR
jgi:hypothetical protein